MSRLFLGIGLEVSHEIVGRTLTLLRSQDRASRNRSFDDFNAPDNRQALNFYRIIKSLEADIEDSGQAGRYQAKTTPEGLVEFKFNNPVLRYTRICYLPQELYAWLDRKLTDRSARAKNPA